jgi:hypothetical protein
MRWPFALLTGLVTGVGAGALTAWVADVVTRAWHVSDREGGRGMLIAFVLIPAGFFFGLVVGTVTARWGARAAAAAGTGAGLAAGLTRVALALLIAAAGIGLVGGLSWLSAPRPLTRDGNPLILEYEVRIPIALVPEGGFDRERFTASLFASERDNQWTDVDYDSIRQENGATIVPGRVPLQSRSLERTMMISLGAWPSYVIDVALPPKPGPAEEAWSEWRPSERMADLAPVPPEKRIEMRYRVKSGTATVSQ